MLPPDNFQEEPKPVVAHRTSPTNIGLYLPSIAAARDFGWLGILEMAERLNATFGTMNALERFRGHFYNWYDTQDLRPLDPKYVSSVDSGNLAGHLLVVANSMREIVAGPVIGLGWRPGIEDGVDLTRECISRMAAGRRTETVTRRHLDDALATLSVTLLRAARTPAEIAESLTSLALESATVIDIARTLDHERGDRSSAEILKWAESLRASILSHQRDVEQFMPWAKLAADATQIAAVNAREGVSRFDAVGRLFASVPTIADLPAGTAVKRRLQN